MDTNDAVLLHGRACGSVCGHVERLVVVNVG
jgi:hypothetical protein